jgi:hypothetical protein
MVGFCLLLSIVVMVNVDVVICPRFAFMPTSVMPWEISIMMLLRGAGWMLSLLSGGSSWWRSVVGSGGDNTLFNKCVCDQIWSERLLASFNVGYRGGGQGGEWQSSFRFGSGELVRITSSLRGEDSNP